MKTDLRVDLQKHISLHIAGLKFFNIWLYVPYNKCSYKYWLSLLVTLILVMMTFVIPVITQSVYLVRFIRSGSAGIQEIAGIVNLIITESLAGIKLLDLRLRRAALSELSNQLTEEYFQVYDVRHKRILEKSIKISRILYIALLLGSGLDVLVQVVIVPGLRHFQTLPLKMDFVFFDANDPTYFKYVCAYQISYKPMMVTTYVTFQSLTWAFMLCASSQLDVLINKLENMKELVETTKAEKCCNENEAFEIIFRDCVLHYSAITRFVKTLQSAFSGQMSLTLFVSASINGSTAIQIFSIESPGKNITEVIWVLAYLSIFIANLFAECYFGDSITHKSLHVATAVYGCPWQGLPMKMKQKLLMFMVRTQQPMVLIAAHLAPVSLETFTTIMDWTYKAFAVMNQMKK